MPFPIHTVEVVDGSVTQWSDRVILGIQLAVANAAGSGSGASVTTTVTFPSATGGLPPNFAVLVSPNQACAWSVTNKTWQGFDVVLTPLTGTLASGLFDIVLLA
jgi:hypothetical protein